MNKFTTFVALLGLVAITSASDRFLVLDDFDCDSTLQMMNSEENNEFVFAGENAETALFGENSEEAFVPEVIPPPSDPTEGIVLVDFNNFSTIEYEYEAEGAEVIEDGDSNASSAN